MTTTPDRNQAVGLDNPPAQPPTWPPYAPPSAARGRWSLPVAIVIAAIVVSASAIAIALITHSSAPAPAPAAPASAAPVSAADADSSTCTAWRSASAVLDQTAGLPDGWDWTTPGIDQLIASRNAVITKTMNLFESQIADQPAGLAKEARAYVSARRVEVAKLADHTYTGADGVGATAGAHQLDQMCRIGN